MSMTTATLVPVDEYLATSYEPDREYVDTLASMTTAFYKQFWQPTFMRSASASQSARLPSSAYKSCPRQGAIVIAFQILVSF